MILNFDEMEEVIQENFKGGEKSYKANIFFDGTNRIMRGTLIPGASIGLHTHEADCEVIFYLEGSGVAIYDGKEERVGAGMCHYCSKGHEHTLKNDGDVDLVFYAVVAKQ